MASIGPEINRFPDGYLFNEGEIVDTSPKSDLPPAWLRRMTLAMDAATISASVNPNASSIETQHPSIQSRETGVRSSSIVSWRTQKVAESEEYYEQLAA